MGYQLLFWQQDEDAAPVLDTYRALMQETPAHGRRQLPVESILGDLADEFPGMDPLPSATGLSLDARDLRLGYVGVGNGLG